MIGTKLNYEIVGESERIILKDSLDLVVQKDFSLGSNEMQKFFQACKHISYIVLEDFNKCLVNAKGSLILSVFDDGFSYKYS